MGSQWGSTQEKGEVGIGRFVSHAAAFYREEPVERRRGQCKAGAQDLGEDFVPHHVPQRDRE